MQMQAACCLLGKCRSGLYSADRQKVAGQMTFLVYAPTQQLFSPLSPLCSREQLLVLILHVESRGTFLLILKHDAKKSAGLLGRSAPWLGTPKWLNSNTRKCTLEQGTLQVTAWDWGQPINTLQHHFI